MKKASTIKLRDLRIMKFGGTSVGDANCIRRAAEIVRSAVCDSDLVVVVSAMGSVTNQLLEAAACWEGGDRDAGAATFARIRDRHDVAVNSLLSSPEQRSAV